MGIKPTYGRVSRSGLIAYGSSLDCVGPLARTVEDAALMLTAIAGALDPAPQESIVLLRHSISRGFKDPLSPLCHSNSGSQEPVLPICVIQYCGSITPLLEEAREISGVLCARDTLPVGQNMQDDASRMLPGL